MRAAIALAAAMLLVAASAQAQFDPGATADLGTGYGQLALSQSILSGTRDQAGSKGRPQRAQPKQATARQLRTLRFVPSATVTRANDARVAAVLLATCPPDRAGCPASHEQLIAEHLPTGGFLRLFSANLEQLMNGSSRNLADVTAGFVVLVWHVQRARTDERDQLTQAERAGARRFMRGTRNALALNQRIRRLSDARQQRLAETMANLAQHGISLHRAYLDQGLTPQADDLRRYLREVAQDWLGVDVADLRLTSRGFARR